MNVKMSYDNLLQQLSRMADTNKYLTIQNNNLLIKNRQLQKEKLDLEKKLALIKKPQPIIKTSSYDPYEHLLFIIL